MSKAINYFNRVTPEYLNKCTKGIHGYLKKRELEAIYNELKLFPESTRVCDLGSGPGFYQKNLKILGKTFNWTVIDSSEHSKIFFDENINFIHADILDYPQVEKNQDIILCLGVLEFIKKPEKLAKYFHSLLCTNGKVYILYPRLNLFTFFYYIYHKIFGEIVVRTDNHYNMLFTDYFEIEKILTLTPVSRLLILNAK